MSQQAVSGIAPLAFGSNGKQKNRLVPKLMGKEAIPLAKLAADHSVHQQAINAMIAEVFRYELLWCKGSTFAAANLTPAWALLAVREAVMSIFVLGYFAYRKVKETVEIAPLATLDLMYQNGEWRIMQRNVASQWTLVMITAPFKTRETAYASYSSATARATDDTHIYDEIYENYRKRDFFNSRPGCFTTVDRNLRNQNGSSKQWFQQATASDVAANRTQVSIDSNFQTLVQNRAASIQRLQQQTAMERQRLSGANPEKLAASNTTIANANTNMMHTEHVITDGREMHTAPQLLSMLDGFKILNNAVQNIFFHYEVPPQVFGKSVNSERTGVNPRLNEIVLTTFFSVSSAFRLAIEPMFKDCEVEGAVLKFKPTLSQFELQSLSPFIKDEHLPDLYAAAYHVPVDIFDPKKFKNVDFAAANGTSKTQGGGSNEQKPKRHKAEIAAEKAQLTAGKPAE